MIILAEVQGIFKVHRYEFDTKDKTPEEVVEFLSEHYACTFTIKPQIDEDEDE